MDSRIVGMLVKQLNETFTEEEFARLADVKDGRTWRKAILEEFGVNND